jgi:hypothetical protein
VRGVLWLTHQLNVLFRKHQLYKLLCDLSRNRQAILVLWRRASHRFIVRPCAAQWWHTARFDLSRETFWTGLVFPTIQSGTFTVFNGANSDMNWHWTVSCADAAEQNSIMAGINEFHRRTTIRMVRHNSPPSGDYVHITGQNTGCWSFVGRQGGVSNTAHGVVKKSPSLRTAPLGFTTYQTQIQTGLSPVTPPPPPLWTILQLSCSNCSNSLTNQLWVHQLLSEGIWNLVQ